MAKNQTEKNELKRKFTEKLQGAVEGLFGGTEEDSVTVNTVKGFVLQVDGEYIEVSAVVKKADFDLEDAVRELEEKEQKKAEREAERLAKAKKREAEKKAKSAD